MSNYVNNIAELVAGALRAQGQDVLVHEVAEVIEEPKNRELGDLAFPCFRWAKSMRLAPGAIATSIANAIVGSLTPESLVTAAQATGPYVNFRINSAARAKQLLAEAIADGYGQQTIGAGKTIGIDYSSPNIAKPFGIGHLRSTAIGNALSNIFKALGYRVVGVNHLGDWGTQFGNMMAGFERWGERERLQENPILYMYELYVRFHQESKSDEALAEEGRSWFRRLEQGEEQAVAYWTEFRALSLLEFQRIYDRLDVKFDYDWGEAFYNDKLDKMVADVEAAGLTEISQGALIVSLEDAGMAPCLLRKSDGATLYATRDLAAARYRYEQFKFDRFLYVVGAPQAEHFKQVFEVLRRMGYDWADRCVHVAFGHIHGISTRKGTLVFLEEILNTGRKLVLDNLEQSGKFDAEMRDRIAEQIAIGSVIFYDLSRNRIKDYDFSWDLMLKGLNPGERGQTGVYVQYTHARTVAVVDHYKQTFGTLPSLEKADFTLLGEPEAAMIAWLEKWPVTLRKAADECEPSEVTRYVLELANEFNSYYSGGNKIVSESDAALSHTRAVLALAVRKVMRMGLEILGVPTPERI